MLHSFRKDGKEEKIYYLHFSPAEFFAALSRAAKRYEGFENFRNIRWFGAGELFG